MNHISILFTAYFVITFTVGCFDFLSIQPQKPLSTLVNLYLYVIISSHFSFQVLPSSAFNPTTYIMSTETQNMAIRCPRLPPRT